MRGRARRESQRRLRIERVAVLDRVASQVGYAAVIGPEKR